MVVALLLLLLLLYCADIRVCVDIYGWRRQQERGKHEGLEFVGRNGWGVERASNGHEDAWVLDLG